MKLVLRRFVLSKERIQLNGCFPNPIKICTEALLIQNCQNFPKKIFFFKIFENTFQLVYTCPLFRLHFDKKKHVFLKSIQGGLRAPPPKSTKNRK